ncbi:MAG TPA: DUF1501 domain-containing protein [Burkholderiales bacterium]|nr:DUF1501 domain-containing protein [Burkholderiales bacterium]
MQRRQFLFGGAAAVAALWLPEAALAQVARDARGYRRLLVLVELKGGNDGLNTVVPYADPAYYALRPRIAVKRDEVLQLDARTGLHPALASLVPLWRAGELAVVQGLGYPDPNLSHFRSIEIWDTASASDQYLDAGWLARVFAAQPVPVGFAADGVVVRSNDMGPLAGPGTRAIALNDPGQFKREARLARAVGRRGNEALNHILAVEADIVKAAAHLSQDVRFRTEFPQGPFGEAVRTAAELAANRAGVAAVRISLNGFDTHHAQPGQQQRLLAELAGGLAALKSALIEIGRWDSTLAFTYTEFGRRPRENDTLGTDHGTANAHFVLGGRVRGGLYGQAPRFDDLEEGNLHYAVDFRSLYATALERWWGVDSARVLEGRFTGLDLLKV